MSTRDPRYGTTSDDPFTPTGEQGSTNEAERLDDSLTEPTTWTSSEYLQGVTNGTSNTRQEPGTSSGSQAGDIAGQAQEKVAEMGQKAQELGQTAQEKAGEIGHMAQEKADAGMNAAASGLDQAASMLRQQGEQRDDAMGAAATRTADTLGSASAYLRDKDTSQVLDDVEAFVRQRPVESVLIAAGIGFVLSKVVK